MKDRKEEIANREWEENNNKRGNLKRRQIWKENTWT